ncbi:MAG: cytochrome c family protein [Alphaproteobacteria bacterium]|nr:cytochrome c family protein [Alphaproteobacteria bacterium]
MKRGLFLALAAALALSASALANANEAGEKVFKSKCATCHTLDAGKNRVGPSLHGIAGRPAAQIAGFKYSDDMKGSKIVWTDDKLDAYLEDPKKVVPKGTMVFVGLKKAEERKDVIAYIKSKK